MSEHHQQVALISWARSMAGQIPELKMLYANPLGGKRAIKTGKMLKAEGVRAGIPDLTLPVPSRGFHGMFIEMKYGRNTVTALQERWIEKLREYGYYCPVCYSFEAARESILWYLERKAKP